MHDQLVTGRRFRVLNIVNDVTRECLRAVADTSISAAFAAKLEQQRAGLTPPVASPALMRDNTGRSLVAAG